MNEKTKLLLELLEQHGAVPGFELTAAGFNIERLLTDGLIMRGVGRYDAGRYLAGPALEALTHSQLLNS